MSLAKPLLFAVIMVAMHALPAARAATPTVPEAEINYLLEFIEQSGCDFYRNGTWYDAQQAQAHLRAKYNALAARNEIKTAEDFIEKAASESSLSGRPYQIRCGGSAAIPTGQWLSAALAQYRKYRSRYPCARCLQRRAQGLPIHITSRQSSSLTVRSLWTDFTCSVWRARDTACAMASWLLAVPVSHTIPFWSVST